MDFNNIFKRNNNILKDEKTILTNINQMTQTLKLSLMDSILSKDKSNLNNDLKINKNEELSDLKILSNIGKGAFSEVYQVIDNLTNKEYALRLCLINENKFNYARAIKEIEIFKQLNLINSEYIAKIHSFRIINNENNLYLQSIMELGVCTLEDVLKKRMKIKKYWNEIEILKIIYMINKALSDSQEYGVHTEIYP